MQNDRHMPVMLGVCMQFVMVTLFIALSPYEVDILIYSYLINI